MKEKKEKIKIKPSDIQDLGEVELPDIVEDEFGNKININEAIEQAEKDIEARLTERIQIRLSKKELERCKQVAQKLGLPYTTYIRSVLKQALDKIA